MIKVDIENNYEAISVREDFRRFTFNSTLTNQDVVELHVVISEHPDELLPGVFNLAFDVRLLRNGNIETDNDGAPFFKPRPEPFDMNRKLNGFI